MLHWNSTEHVASIPPGRLPVVFGHDGFYKTLIIFIMKKTHDCIYYLYSYDE